MLTIWLKRLHPFIASKNYFVFLETLFVHIQGVPDNLFPALAKDSFITCHLGAASKKVVLLGCAHHKVATPPPPPVVVKVPLFFVENFFMLKSPETEKKLSDLKVKFPPPPPHLNYAKYDI